MSTPSFALSVLRDAKENSEKKMAALEILELARPFFLAVFFRVTQDGQNKRGTSRS